MSPINVLIVDDHPMMRAALRMALSGESDMRAVGEACNGAQALSLLMGQPEEVAPDVILLDLLMPGMDGLDTMAHILEARPEAKVLVFTSLEDQEQVLAAIQAGALGYLSKSASHASLIEAIRSVARGAPYLPEEIALKLMHGVRMLSVGPSSSKAGESVLTSRQQRVLALIGEGHTDLEIGKILHIEPPTVRAHIHNILQRLDLETRAQLAVYSNRGGHKNMEPWAFKSRKQK